MRASWLFVPILGLALGSCDGLFGPWKKENPSCTGTDCTTPTPCTAGEPGCLGSEDLGVPEPCTASACSTAGCWETICLPALRGHAPTAMWINTVGKVYLTTKAGKIITVTEPSSAGLVMEEFSPQGTVPPVLSGIFGYDDTYLWAINAAGKVLHRVGAMPWTEMSSGLPVPLSDVSALNHQNVWVAAADGQLLFFDGTRWESKGRPLPITPLYGVWTTPEGDAVTVGANGAISKYSHTSGYMAMAVGAVQARLNDVWGLSKTDIWIAGGETTGIILHWNGASWVTVPIDPGPALLSVWGDGSDVWFVGQGGRIVRARGTQVVDEPSPTDKTLVAVFGCPTTGVIAVSESGTLLRRRPG
jgi:hypothetical protein